MLNRFDGRLLRIDVVGDFLATPQDNDAIDHLKHVVNVMGDKDTRMPRVAGAADEAQDALSFFDAQQKSILRCWPAGLAIADRCPGRRPLRRRRELVLIYRRQPPR